jgi:hypothetical protein
MKKNENSYYGRLNPVVLEEKKTIQTLMLNELIKHEIDKLDKKLTSQIDAGLSHLRKEIYVELKKSKMNAEIIPNVRKTRKLGE